MRYYFIWLEKRYFYYNHSIGSSGRIICKFVVYSFSAKGRIPKNRPNRRIQEEIIKGKSSRMNEVNIIKGIALPKQKSKINKNVQKIREIYLSEKKHFLVCFTIKLHIFVYGFFLWKVISQFFFYFQSTMHCVSSCCSSYMDWDLQLTYTIMK